MSTLDESPEPDEGAALSAAPSGSKKPGLLGRIGRGALRVVVALLLIVALAVAFTQTSAFKGILREQLLEATNDALAGRVELGELSGDLFSGIEATEARVYDADGKLAIAVERVEAEYALLGLLDGELVIERLKLVRPVGLMRYDEQGELNLLQIAKPSDQPETEQSASSLGIRVDAIFVEGGTLLYLNEQTIAEEPLPEQGAAALNELRALLDSPEEMLREDLEERVHALLRRARASGPVPALAMVAGLSVQSAFSLDAEGAMTLEVDPLSATLDANPWIGPLAVSAEEVNVGYSPEALRVAATSLLFGEESGLKPLVIEVDLIPAEEGKRADALSGACAGQARGAHPHRRAARADYARVGDSGRRGARA